MDPRRFRSSIACLIVLCAASRAAAAPSPEELTRTVAEVENAFAKTMAVRDHAAFSRFLSDEAVFVGTTRVLRGKAAVAGGWLRYFEGAEAPFSWASERVEVLASGKLALSTGPVFDPSGRRVGTFNSVWRREKGGAWKIVLDNGCPPCDCGASAKE